MLLVSFVETRLSQAIVSLPIRAQRLFGGTLEQLRLSRLSGRFSKSLLLFMPREHKAGFLIYTAPTARIEKGYLISERVIGCSKRFKTVFKAVRLSEN